MSKQTSTRSLIWVLFLLSLGMPLLIRYINGAPITPLDPSYAHFAQQTNLYELLLAIFPTAFLPLVLGIISFWLLSRMTNYALLLFIITPLTITLFTTHSPAALFFPIAILAFLARKKHKWLTLLATPALVFTDVAAAFIFLIFFAAFILKENKQLGAGILLLLSITITYHLTTFGFPSIHASPLFGEFGSVFGYSIFVILLGAVFVIQHWRTMNVSVVIAWLALFYLSSYLPTVRPLVLIPLVLYAAAALRELTQQKWHLTFLKQASFLLLVCLGIFVMLTHMKVLATETPQESLLEIAERSDVDPRLGTILTTTYYEHSLRYFSERKVVAIPPEHEFWNSVSLGESATFLTEKDVRFIMITPGMISGEVWQREEGFRFLMLNNGKFIKVLETQEYELWLVLQEFVQ